MSEDQGDYPVVWEATVDEGKYLARVIRTAEYTGLLTLHTDEGKELLEKVVGLAYDAKFGPDAGDVWDWQDACIKAINLEKGSDDKG